LDNILAAFGAFGTGLIVAGVLLRLSWKADDAISKGERDTLSRWLRIIEIDDSPPSWPNTFLDVFDRIFGQRHWSWRCFFASACASSIVIVIVISLWVIIRPNQFGNFLTEIIEYDLSMILIMFLVMYFCNIILDYASLLQTRFFIVLMNSSAHNLRIFLFLALDILCTSVIFYIGASIVRFILIVIYVVHVLGVNPPIRDVNLISLSALFTHLFESTYYFTTRVLDLSVSPVSAILFGVFFCSTFFTSIWLWLYGLSWRLVRLVPRAGPLLGELQRLMPIRTHPLRALSEVAAAIACLSYWLIAGLGIAFGTDAAAATPPTSAIWIEPLISASLI
jgi:hypothetical protein